MTEASLPYKPMSDKWLKEYVKENTYDPEIHSVIDTMVLVVVQSARHLGRVRVAAVAKKSHDDEDSLFGDAKPTDVIEFNLSSKKKKTLCLPNAPAHKFEAYLQELFPDPNIFRPMTSELMAKYVDFFKADEQSVPIRYGTKFHKIRYEWRVLRASDETVRPPSTWDRDEPPIDSHSMFQIEESFATSLYETKKLSRQVLFDKPLRVEYVTNQVEKFASMMYFLLNNHRITFLYPDLNFVGLTREEAQFKFRHHLQHMLRRSRSCLCWPLKKSSFIDQDASDVRRLQFYVDCCDGTLCPSRAFVRISSSGSPAFVCFPSYADGTRGPYYFVNA